MVWRLPFLSAQKEQIFIRKEVGNGVQYNNLIDFFFFHILLNASGVEAQVPQMNFRKILRQEGSQRIGVAVPDQQQLGGIGMLCLDGAQRLNTAQKVGVFILKSCSNGWRPFLMEGAFPILPRHST